MAAQKTARASPELRKGSTQPALPSVLHHHPGHKLKCFRVIGNSFHNTASVDGQARGRNPHISLVLFHLF